MSADPLWRPTVRPARARTPDEWRDEARRAAPPFERFAGILGALLLVMMLLRVAAAWWAGRL